MEKDVKELLRDDVVYGAICILLDKGYSVSMNKVRIIKYVLDNPNISIKKISDNLKIDYKNTWRIMKELYSAEILYFVSEVETTEQGKKSKWRVLRDKKKEEKKIYPIF